MDQDAKETSQDVDQKPGATSVEKTETSETKKEVVLHTDEDVVKIRAEESARWQSIRDKERVGHDETVKERDKLRAESEERRRQDDEAETKRAQEEGPEALDILTRRRALRDEAAITAKAKAEAEAKIAEAKDIVQWKLDKAIEDKAKETGLSAEDIRTCGPQTLEEVDKAADLVAKIKGTPAPTSPDKKPDSGITAGGGGGLEGKSPMELAKMAYDKPKK